MTRPAFPNEFPASDSPGRAYPVILIGLVASSVAAVGLASLIGLVAGYAPLIHVATGGGPLAVFAALGLVAAAATLWLRGRNPGNESGRGTLGHAWEQWAVRLLTASIIVGGITIFTLRLLHVLPSPRGQMPTLAFAFFLIGVSFVLADIRYAGRRLWLQLPLLPVLWISLLVILSRFYGIRTMNTYFEVLLFPVQTAVPLCALAAGIFLLHPREGVCGILTSRYSGGVVARIALPVMLLLPFTVGWIRMRALRTGLHDLAGAFAQFSSTNTLMFCGFILFSAHVLNRLDARRQETLESLRTANAELEARIAEQRRAEAAREESERQLFQAQKMEAMGVLASGIAHDFNNILTVILLNAEEAEASPHADPAQKRNIGEIRKSGERAAGLIRQIMAFGRNEPGARGPVSLGEVIAEADEVLRPVVPAGTVLNTSVGSDLPEVEADAGQLRQVLLNLANNALHAMEGRDGRLEIRASLMTPDETLPPNLEPGRYVTIAVKDSGRGMDAETAKRIFDPFFTTKAPGKGTGLGLSVVHGIMRLHEGAVTVHSEPDRGTEFRLYLPVGKRKPEA
jgi:signal transduction histidine kinase